MMNDKEKILNSGILEQYVLGLLDEEDINEVEAYLQKYPDLNDHVKGIQNAMEQVLIQNAIEPPPRLRQDIISEIDNLDKPNKKLSPRNPVRVLPLLATLAAVGMVVLAFLFLRNNQQRNDKLDRLGKRYENLQERHKDSLAQCKKTTAFLQSEIDYLLNPATQNIQFKVSEGAPEAIAVIHFNNKAKKVLLHIGHLPNPPADKQYQLWADVEGHMIDMGVFDAKSKGLQEMHFVSNPKSLNITLEPLGGSKEATVSQLKWNVEV